MDDINCSVCEDVMSIKDAYHDSNNGKVGHKKCMMKCRMGLKLPDEYAHNVLPCKNVITASRARRLVEDNKNVDEETLVSLNEYVSDKIKEYATKGLTSCTFVFEPDVNWATRQRLTVGLMHLKFKVNPVHGYTDKIEISWEVK